MRCLLLLAAFALASCGYCSGPLPDRTEIVRVEQAISKAPCIGEISNWGRTYQYHLRPNSLAVFLSKLDRDVIDFDLSRGSKPGGFRRRPPYPPIGYILDDLSMARGSYNLRSGKLEFQFC